jgi:hypothetical protein
MDRTPTKVPSVSRTHSRFAQSPQRESKKTQNSFSNFFTAKTKSRREEYIFDPLASEHHFMISNIQQRIKLDCGAFSSLENGT